MGSARTIVTVGNFDGVHAGHRAIVARALELRERLGARGGVVVLAFDPHPVTVLSPARAPARLTTFEERAALLREAGAARVERMEPSPGFLGLTPERFVDRVCESWSPAAFVEGPDFRFGKGRAGSVGSLREMGRTRGFEVHEATPLAVALSDHTVVTASSSITRWLLGEGRVRDAWSVLGRPHRLGGLVVPGDRRGRTLGFPTANLDTPNMLPADGVYASVAHLPDGRRLAGALSVGDKPMFGGVARVAEVYLLDAPREPGGPAVGGLPEYGWPIGLDVVGWVRDQMRFDSVERLVEQMGRDCERVREQIETVRGGGRSAMAATT